MQLTLPIPTPHNTYRVSTWDFEDESWTPEETGLTQWQLRNALRALYARGYSQVSIQVRAETHTRPAKRWSRPWMPGDLPKSVRRKLEEQYTQ